MCECCDKIPIQMHRLVQGEQDRIVGSEAKKETKKPQNLWKETNSWRKQLLSTTYFTDSILFSSATNMLPTCKRQRFDNKGLFHAFPRVVPNTTAMQHSKEVRIFGWCCYQASPQPKATQDNCEEALTFLCTLQKSPGTSLLLTMFDKEAKNPPPCSVCCVWYVLQDSAHWSTQNSLHQIKSIVSFAVNAYGTCWILSMSLKPPEKIPASVKTCIVTFFFRCAAPLAFILFFQETQFFAVACDLDFQEPSPSLANQSSVTRLDGFSRLQRNNDDSQGDDSHRQVDWFLHSPSMPIHHPEWTTWQCTGWQIRTSCIAPK